jgi:hypothetical protein
MHASIHIEIYQPTLITYTTRGQELLKKNTLNLEESSMWRFPRLWLLSLKRVKRWWSWAEDRKRECKCREKTYQVRKRKAVQNFMGFTFEAYQVGFWTSWQLFSNLLREIFFPRSWYAYVVMWAESVSWKFILVHETFRHTFVFGLQQDSRWWSVFFELQWFFDLPFGIAGSTAKKLKK